MGIKYEYKYRVIIPLLKSSYGYKGYWNYVANWITYYNGYDSNPRVVKWRYEFDSNNSIVADFIELSDAMRVWLTWA